jgi:precorrin-6A/cobalt-precorrin-6A reductase
MKRVLILGGTGDAANLAASVSNLQNIEVITSLAGRTGQPAMPQSTTRVGGFGGTSGLAVYLREHQIDALIDATHPFAAQISWNASVAAHETGIPHLMLIRPAWEKSPKDLWIEVDSVEAAATNLPVLAKRVFLTIGRQQLAPFALLQGIWFLMRSIEPPASDLVVLHGEILLKRGPFSIQAEKQLLQDYNIDAIVSKNSGGDATYAKVIAAQTLGIPIVMVQRPAMPLGDTVGDIENAMIWLMQTLF